MSVALTILGGMLGLIIGSGSAKVLGLVAGASIGFAVAEVLAQRGRGARLENEVRHLQERLGAVQRRLRELEGEPATESGSRAEPAPPRSVAEPARAPPQSKWAPPPSSSAHSSGQAGAQSTQRSPGPEASHTAESAQGADSAILRAVREYLTGGNTLVRIGVLILFFGVAFLLRYLAEHSHVPIQVRLSAVACAGIALLVLGWRLRARRYGYALALQGGGVGILYLTTFAALRLYSLLPPGAAFGLFVFLAAFTAVLAVMQDSQAFAFLAVTGGFLAPILASTGEGSHVALFSYYAILNGCILAMAWYKAWRPLNLAGFVFTFIVSAAWGVLRYRPEFFNSTEPFLILFFAFYVAIAVLFSLRQTPQLRGYVDGTLVFGTPLIAFGYQSALLAHQSLRLSVSALTVGVFYFLLAWGLRRRQLESQRLLAEAFIALGVVFFTVAVPLGLDGKQSGVTWALEGAGLVWIGVRQNRVFARAFGVLLQFAAGLALWAPVTVSASREFSSFGAYLGCAVAAVAAVLSAVLFEKYADRLRSSEAANAPLLYFFGLLSWLGAGVLEIRQQVAARYDTAADLIFFALTALMCSELARRELSKLSRLPALGLLWVLVVLALGVLERGSHPFASGGWLAWPLAMAAVYFNLRLHEGKTDGSLVRALHTVAAWLAVALLGWELEFQVDHALAGRGTWSAVVLALPAAAAVFVVPRWVQSIAWPFRAHRQVYMVPVSVGFDAFLVAWSLAANLALRGDPYPFPYVPLLNALDLGQAFVLLVLVRHWLHVQSEGYDVDVDSWRVPAVSALTALFFLWLNAVLVRTLHFWAGVPYGFENVVGSTLVQTSISIFWTVLALATMLVATRRGSRVVWLTGAALLGVTILKLFLVDLSRVGTVERIVSFVGVGLLTLVIGYFSPLPPSAGPQAEEALSKMGLPRRPVGEGNSAQS